MERNVFKLMSSERATSNSDYPVNSSAGEYRIEIRSRKQKLVNGKVTETTTPSCKATIIESWLHYRVEVDSEANILNFYLTVDANTSVNSRTSTVIIKQDDSGNTIYLKVTQAAGTVQEYVLTTSILGLFLPVNGGTRTCEVQSYALMTDGSKNPIFPTNMGQPAWVTGVTIEQVSEERFNVTIKAGVNNTVSSRNGNLTLKTPGDSVEGVELEIPLNQMAPVTEQDITLILKLPEESFTGALFADGETPVNSSGTGRYFAFQSMFGQFSLTFKPSVGIIVNLSSPGSTKYAKPGDRVKIYKSGSNGSDPSNETWSYIGTFTMPSTDATITV